MKILLYTQVLKVKQEEIHFHLFFTPEASAEMGANQATPKLWGGLEPDLNFL